MSDNTPEPSEQQDSSLEPPRSTQNPKTNFASLTNPASQFKFGAPPPRSNQQPRAVTTENSTQANPSFLNSNSQPFKATSKSGPSSTSTSSTDQEQKRKGERGGNVPSVGQGRTNSLEQSDGEEGDMIVTVPVPGSSSSTQRQPTASARATPGQALSKGGLGDLSRFRIGSAIGSPVPPASLAAQSRPSTSHQTFSHNQAGVADHHLNRQAISNQDYSSFQSQHNPQPRPPTATSRPTSHPSSDHSYPPQNQQTNNKKRSHSNDPPSRNSPPFQQQPRSNTAGSITGAQGMSNAVAKKRRVDTLDPVGGLRDRANEFAALANEAVNDLSVKVRSILRFLRSSELSVDS